MGAVLSCHKLVSRVRRLLKKPFYKSKCNSSEKTLVESVFAHNPKFSEKILYFEPAAERVKHYISCPDASRASCHFADSGETEVEVSNLILYRRQVPGSDGNLVIGVGLKSPSGEITPLVLIENDDSGHGIHFTGRAADDPSQTLVACLRDSSQLHPIVRHIIYLDFLLNLQNRSATFIWDWWRSGADMDRMDWLLAQAR